MSDELDLVQLVSGGQKLARIDDVDYLEVSVIFAWPVVGQPAIYCQRADWPTTPAARLFARDRQLRELEEAFGLQASEALKQAQRAEAAARRIAELERQLAAQTATMNVPERMPTTGGVEKRVLCDHCGKRIWPDLFEKHLAEKHPSAPDVPIQLIDDSPAWRCAAKGCSGAFTRDLRDPMFCTQHAVHTNGVEAMEAQNG